MLSKGLSKKKTLKDKESGLYIKGRIGNISACVKRIMLKERKIGSTVLYIRRWAAECDQGLEYFIKRE